jgi:hypothetical protein
MTSPENPTGPVHPVWGPPPAPAWGAPPPPPGTAPGAPAWGPPGQPAGPAGGRPPPRKRRLTWLWFLIPVLVVFLASATVVAVFGVKLYEQPIDATNDYYAAIRGGRYSDAYNQLCSSRRFTITQSDFVAQQTRENDAKPLDSYDFIGLDFPKSDDSSIDIITTGSVTRNGVDHDVRVGMVREDDDWRVCEINED